MESAREERGLVDLVVGLVIDKIAERVNLAFRDGPPETIVLNGHRYRLDPSGE